MKQYSRILFFSLLFIFSLGFVFSDDIVIDSAPVKIVLHEYSGSFSIYKQSNKNGKYISIIENSNHSLSSYFSLKIDEDIIKLQQNAGIKISVDYIDNGGYIRYEIPERAVVTVSFIPVNSTGETGTNCIRVMANVQNLDAMTHRFTLKAVFDTILGESLKAHFITGTGKKLESAAGYLSPESYRYFVSAGKYDSASFLLYGNGLSTPSYAAVASRDLLLSNTWIPEITDGRTFDSIQTYNNSALGIYWRTITLSSMISGSYSFYIACSPVSDRYLTLDDIPEAAITVQPVTDSKEPTATYTDSYGTTYTVGAYREEQLDPVYISNLLDKIHNLEAEGSNLDEIKKLSAELDAIMKKLENMKAVQDDGKK